MVAPAPFSLGSNSQGQLGLGHADDTSVPKPVVFHPDYLPPSSPIVQVAAGGNHTLLLMGSGEVWAAGDVSSGACGTPSRLQYGTCNHSRSSPHIVESGNKMTTKTHVGRVFQLLALPHEAKVTKIACTWTTSILVCNIASQGTHRQRIYTFGVGARGELGRPATSSDYPPIGVAISDFPPPGSTVVDISASISHVAVVLSDDTVWGWGAGRKGQLGYPSETAIETPRRVSEIDFPVCRVACGKEYTAIFGPPATGIMKILGGEKLALSGCIPRHVPDYIDVGAGWSSLYVLLKDGRILSWGKNTYGQLAPQNLPPVVEMAVGSEHVIVLTEEGHVLSWGWGEHGNCGPTAEKDGVVKGTWNFLASSKLLKSKSRISRLGAGCATSWILSGTEELIV